METESVFVDCIANRVLSSTVSCSPSLCPCCRDSLSKALSAKTCEHWNLADSSSLESHQKPKLPLKSFNHISREVLSLAVSIEFYCNILGFVQIKRPAFEQEGVWLWGYGLSLHLIATNVPKARIDVKNRRIVHFTQNLPCVDHFAFLTDDLHGIIRILDDAKVYHKDTAPAGTGIEQVFVFDPDGNVIEISNCAPPINESVCQTEEDKLK